MAGSPIIYTIDNEEVIKNFIQDIRAESLDISMEYIQDAPTNMYKEQKKRKEKKISNSAKSSDKTNKEKNQDH